MLKKDKIIPRLSEGMTLIMSVGIIYWIIDHGFNHPMSYLIKIFMIVGLLIAGFSIINAFVSIKLTESLRLFLSIWSSVILALLACDNIYSMYQNGQIEDQFFFADKLIVGMQFFLLGVCSVYIVQNIYMIIGFLPSKYRFFNKEYFKDIKALKKDHVSRFSENQSSFTLSLVCLILSVGFFAINYSLNILPRNTAIWITFFLLNNLVIFYDTHYLGYNSKDYINEKPASQ